MRASPLALSFASLALAVAACSGISDLDPKEACLNAGYSIASRTLACLSDPAAANAHYRRLDQGVDCKVTAPAQIPFICAVSLNQATCDEVRAYGDDIDRWLGRHVVCTEIFVHKDGSAIASQPLGSDAVVDNPVCDRAADAIIAMGDQCNAGFNAGSFRTGYRCLARWSDPDNVPLASADACIAEIRASDCEHFSSLPIESMVDAAPACALLLVPR